MLRRTFLAAPLLPLTDQARSVMQMTLSQDEKEEDALTPPLTDILEHFPRDQHQRVYEVVGRAKSSGWLRLGVWGGHRGRVTLKSLVGIDPRSGFMDFLWSNLLR